MKIGARKSWMNVSQRFQRSGCCCTESWKGSSVCGSGAGDARRSSCERAKMGWLWPMAALAEVPWPASPCLVPCGVAHR